MKITQTVKFPRGGVYSALFGRLAKADNKLLSI